MRTEARQRVGSAKQVSQLSLGQNKHGRNKPVPKWVTSKINFHVDLPIFCTHDVVEDRIEGGGQEVEAA